MARPGPIIFIGTQRSGTTWMGNVFAQHPRLAYWSEPRHVWTWGNAYRPDDVLTERHARPAVIRHIQRRFDSFVRQLGKDRLVEKTPSNSLRIPFIHAVYPDAKIVLVIRDGRSVLRSTDEIIHGGVPTHRIASRALDTPFWEWPAYAPRTVSTILRKLTRRPLAYWGPRPPGWRQWIDGGSRHLMLARQWSATIERAVADARALPTGASFVFHYEDLMRQPGETMRQIVDFCELSDADALVEQVAAAADPTRQNKWRQTLDPSILEEIRPIMGPMLESLGYEW